MAKARLDQTGKVYIPRVIRNAAGIKEGDLLDVEAQDSHVLLRKSKLRIAKLGRGQFKLKRTIKDVDRQIEQLSTTAAELSEKHR